MAYSELDSFDFWADDTIKHVNVTRPRNHMPKPKVFSKSIHKFKGSSNRVDSPSHYTRGSQEAIDIIEEAIQDAPTPGKGLLQGQVLKYMLRVWLKDNPLEDLKKARWYLNRLIEKMEPEG